MPTGFRNGSIRLDDIGGVFYSGQIISGCVVFDLDQPLTFSVLSVSYHGEAEVLWTETETEVMNDMEREYTVNYIGHEVYFNYTENLIGGAGTSQLPPGSHAIPFKYRIPSLSPSSFKGSKGEISYHMNAHMTYLDPLSSKDELSKAFEVIAPFDLNVGDPSIRQPINMEFEEVYGCLCACGASPVAVRARLPAAGYCPGQRVPVALDVQNDSSLEITKMKFEIITRECYRSSQPASEFIPPERVLAVAKTGAVMANSSCSLTCNLLVPEMIAPYLENCSLIDVMYFFRITIKVSGCNEEMQDESEIYIGLVPIKEITEGEYVHPLNRNLPNGPIPVLTSLPAVSPQYIQPAMANVNQFGQLQSAPYPNYGTPYPTNNPPYPTENKFETQSAEKKPFRDYEIGFKAPESLSNPPYPNINPVPKPDPPYPRDNLMPSVSPPYPTDNLMPSALPPAPYPKDNLMPHVNPPYINNSFTPSAPPPL